MAAFQKGEFEEIRLGKRLRPGLARECGQKSFRCFPIVCPFIEYLLDPVLAVIIATALGFIAFFNTIDIQPGVDFLSDRVRSSGDVNIIRFDLGPILSLQRNFQRYGFLHWRMNRNGSRSSIVGKPTIFRGV